MSEKLTEKQEIFCKEYIIDLNATQAAIRAGYSVKTANEQGSRMLANVNIQSRISELKQERNEALDIDAQYVLKRLVEIDKMDIADILNDNGSLKPVSEFPLIWRQFISGIDISDVYDYEDGEKVLVGFLKKVKLPDKVKNLELIGKHIKVNAFRENVGLSDPNGKPLNITILGYRPDKKDS